MEIYSSLMFMATIVNYLFIYPNKDAFREINTKVATRLSISSVESGFEGALLYYHG